MKAILKKKPKRDAMPEVLNDPTLGSHGFLHLKDVKIHYVASGEEGKPLMLLVHGFPEFWYSWRFQLREFAKDYRVVAIDMRGYGQSDRPKGVKNYKLEKLIGDMEQIIHALGYKDCVLVGHDWGGIVAYNFAKVKPEMTKKLIMMNAPHLLAYVKHLRSSWKQFKKSWYILFFQMPCFPEFVFSMGDFFSLYMMFKGKGGVQNNNVTKTDVEAYKYAFSRPGGFTGPINFYRALVGNALHRQKDKIPVPTLMIWGTKDLAINTEIAQQGERYFANYTVRYIDGASHWLQMDQPTIVNKHMREFLM